MARCGSVAGVSLVLAAASIVAGCSVSAETAGRFEVQDSDRLGSPPIAVFQNQAASSWPEPAKGTSPSATPADTEPAIPEGAEASEPTRKRLMVYTARFQLLVPSVEDAVDRFLERVDEAGGYLETRKNAVVTVRVPAARFSEITRELRGYGLVTDESLQALDVTKLFYDLRIRIENAELFRTRLLALLEKAEEVDDALRIEGELRRLTEEIDRLKGELKLLSERIAFSTVEVQFSSTAPPARAVPRRTRSRFDWINEVGVEHVIEKF